MKLFSEKTSGNHYDTVVLDKNPLGHPLNPPESDSLSKSIASVKCCCPYIFPAKQMT